ncbi:MAG TPA: tetratricopeptide repeat protein [Polyangiaceae bacterium]|nr:tetratricopeptide repeat protein [Polyangiaceae bacterium]
MQPLWNQGSGNSTGSRSLTQSGVHEVEWSPLEGGAWSQSSPWRDTSLAPRRRSIIAGVGLGLLSILAFAGALSRSVSHPELACNKGAECNRLGVAAAQGAQGARQDPALAVQLYQRACDLGDGSGCNNLGLAFQSGRGVRQDDARALDSFELGCSRDSAEACSNQGAMYEQGRGVAVNLGDATRLYTQACRHGSALGCSNLGVLYAEGRGVAQDRAEALRLFTESCDAGSSIGCNNLAQAHLTAP